MSKQPLSIGLTTAQVPRHNRVENQERQRKYPGLEPWILVREIGAGAFGKVFRAKHSDFQVPEVAIKIIHKSEVILSQVCIVYPVVRDFLVRKS